MGGHLSKIWTAVEVAKHFLLRNKKLEGDVLPKYYYYISIVKVAIFLCFIGRNQAVSLATAREGDNTLYRPANNKKNHVRHHAEMRP